MTRAGHDVTLIDPWPEHVETMRSQGLHLSGMTPEETHTVKVNAIHLTEVQRFCKERPVDIAFICVKAYDTEWATHLIKPYLAPDGYCVSLQNCINEERIAAIVGWGKTLGCIASLVSRWNRVSRGGHHLRRQEPQSRPRTDNCGKHLDNHRHRLDCRPGSLPGRRNGNRTHLAGIARRHVHCTARA